MKQRTTRDRHSQKKTEEKHHKKPVDRKHQKDRSKEGERAQNTRTLKNVVLLIAPLPKRRKETESRLKVPHHP